MMKFILLFMLSILLMTSCKDKTKYVEVLSYEVDVLDPLQLDHKSGETVILMGKIIPAEDNNGITMYQYYIDALDGTWIETNTKFALGDTLILNGLSPENAPEGTTVVFSEIKLDAPALLKSD